MSEIKSLDNICPTCGAKLTIDVNRKRVDCHYCGYSKVLLDDFAPPVTPPSTDLFDLVDDLHGISTPPAPAYDPSTDPQVIQAREQRKSLIAYISRLENDLIRFTVRSKKLWIAFGVVAGLFMALSILIESYETTFVDVLFSLSSLGFVCTLIAALWTRRRVKRCRRELYNSNYDLRELENKYPSTLKDL